MRVPEICRNVGNSPERGPGAFSRLLGLLVGAACLLTVTGLVSPAMANKGDCSQPFSSGADPTASDCAFILKIAVGIGSCQMCVCDVNGSASFSAADALLCLKGAVGQNVTLKCPTCTPVTTTTTTTKPITSTSSTTTSSTSSTTSTIPVSCESNSTCAPLGAPFRCNQFTGTCEKPCTANKDCKDFYECNANKYCAPPMLIY